MFSNKDVDAIFILLFGAEKSQVLVHYVFVFDLFIFFVNVFELWSKVQVFYMFGK